MTAVQEHSVQWHAGEIAMHRLLNGPHYARPNPTATGLSQAHAYRVAISPLVAFGALDRLGRPWTTVLGGKPQFTQAVAPNVLGVQNVVDVDYDPFIDALFGGDGDGNRKKGDGELLRPGPEAGPIMAGLSIDLQTRDRVKLAGRMIAGAVAAQPRGEDDKGSSGAGRVGEVQLAMLVQEALGNCPKYLNKKAIKPHVPHPRLVYDSDAAAEPLPQAGLDLIRRADLFFLSSTDGKTMDTNHRGGPPGILRIANNERTGEHDGRSDGGPDTAITLVYPEFSGNRLYQTLGNLQINPLVGLVIPDFETSNVLYLTGHTKTLVGAEASAYLPHTKLAVHITVDRAILVADGLPFRGEVIDYSPYNPPIRPLLSEIAAAGGDAAAAAAPKNKEPIAMAVLSGRQELAPSVSRFTFTLEPSHDSSSSPVHWQDGQYITLDFGPELDVGWSHMRDDEPQALNDDFIRTFTISSPSPPATGSETLSPISIELTLRRHGPATGLLWRHNLRTHLGIPVLAFGGDGKFRVPVAEDVSETEPPRESIFVASGVGITPMLAQAPRLLSGDKGHLNLNLRVLWSLRAIDVPVAVDSFKRIDGLARHTTIFITDATSTYRLGEGSSEIMQQLQDMGAIVVGGRRIQKEDIVPERGWSRAAEHRKIYICTGPAMLQDLQAWLPGEDLVWESFAF